MTPSMPSVVETENTPSARIHEAVDEAERLLVEVFSPELVLIASPEEARRARERLPDGPVWPPAAEVLPIAVARTSVRRRILDALGEPAFLAFLAFILLDTLAPFVFVLTRG
jgi:hypothetical protein